MPTNFYLSPRPDKSGECPIRVSVSVRGTRLLSTTGFSIKPGRWNAETQRVKASTTTAKGLTEKVINTKLKKIDAEFSDLETKIDHKPTKEELSIRLAAIKGNSRTRVKADSMSHVYSVLDRFDEFLKDGTLNQWTDGTLKHWRGFRKHLEALNIQDYGYFNESGMLAFVGYLRRCEFEESYIQKLYKDLKVFLHWSIRKGYCSDSDISKARIRFKVVEKPVIFLTKEELFRLYDYQIPANGTRVKLTDSNGKVEEMTIHDASTLAKTRDLFCFCAFTSLRYSDMAKVKRTDISGNLLYVTTQKTNDKITIDLNDYSRSILDKYKDVEFPYGRALPIITNQQMNDHLKVLCKLCGINELVSWVTYIGGNKVVQSAPKYSLIGTHAARRTFICFALATGIPPQVVMKWTGHSDYKSMKPYIDIAEKVKASAMEQLNSAWKK